MSKLSDDVAFRERFIRESKLAASLDHPNILPVYDAGDADGVLFLIMRYVDGTDLRALLRSEGRLEPNRTLRIISQVVGALDAAHTQGLVHRDVKPGNILIERSHGPEDQIYLSDFGLTKRMDARTALTQSGTFVGTIDYAAPEQIEGKQLTAAVDEYALGCVLYEALVGSVPYPKDCGPYAWRNPCRQLG